MAKVCISLVAVNTIRRNVHSKISCFVASTGYGKLLGISQKTICMHVFSLLHKIYLSFVYYQSVSLSDKHYLSLFHTNCLYCRHTVFLLHINPLLNTQYLSLSLSHILFVCVSFFHTSFSNMQFVWLSFIYILSLSNTLSLFHT